MKTTTKADINRWLRVFDEKLFAGKLSSWIVVIGDHHAMVDGSLGCCVRREKSIYMPKNIFDLTETGIIGVLLHELAHIRGGDYHGKKFKNEIQRFQQEGAPINKEDLEDVKYATGKFVRWFIDHSIVRGFTLEQAQEIVAKKYSVSTEEFLRRYPKASKGTPGIEDINTPPPWWPPGDDSDTKLVPIKVKKFTP